MKQPIKILLVEDEALTAMAMRMELKHAGYEVGDPIATGEEAITYADREKPDIVLMDIRLAGDIDGIDAAQAILSANDIPIIFMTGYPDKEVMERAKQLNPIAYFIKPVRIYDLQAAIDAAYIE